MRFALIIAGLAAALGSTGVARAQAVHLFNGEDLTGWTYFLDDKSKKMEDVWSAGDGVLVCKGNPAGYIRTKEDYDNYVLELEWRWKPGTKGGNSGVLVHTTKESELGVWPRSLECQLGKGDAGDFWVIGTTIKVADPQTRTSGRRTMNLTDGAENPVGEWNKYVIVCAGDTVTCIVNGEVVNYCWDVSQTRGAICLQSEGAEVHFRNIKLWKLSDE